LISLTFSLNVVISSPSFLQKMDRHYCYLVISKKGLFLNVYESLKDKVKSVERRNTFVLGISRGGVVTAEIVAKKNYLVHSI